MNLTLVIPVIVILSFVLALLSMRDFKLPEELKNILSQKKIKGAIVFFKEKIVHYSGKR